MLKVKMGNFRTIENMINSKGNGIPGQFKIYTDKGTVLQSYSSIICFRDFSGNVFLDNEKWNYSVTTGKYRNLFLNETKRETESKINSGQYKLVNLN